MKTENRQRTGRSTATSTFGVGKRESHDASAFYSRFESPTIIADDNVEACPVPDKIIQGDSRKMAELPDNCIALVTTSPGYWSGKEYETAIGEGYVPSSYVDYLAMLRDVFAECWRVLEPGGRIAVNIANLGRKPYRSLSTDIVSILQDDLGYLLRGEIVWIKAEGASGNCAWGSFASAANPVLRDVTERIVIACKGRFDRAPNRKKREQRNLPFENTISKEDFMAWTLDTWRIPPASARQIGHPAPFPVELPRRLTQLFTFKGDVVLDPFCGAASHAIAALRSDRHYVGYDTEADYVELAESRITAEREDLAAKGASTRT